MSSQSEYLKARQHFQEQAVEAHVWACCLNCMWWTEITHIAEEGLNTFHHCGKYKVIPPPEVVVYGCCEYEPDIPF